MAIWILAFFLTIVVFTLLFVALTASLILVPVFIFLLIMVVIYGALTAGSDN